MPDRREAGLPAMLTDLDGTYERPSRFVKSSALWANDKEIVHADSDGSYDIRLTHHVIRSMRSRLAADDRVRLRPSSSADWVGVEIRTEEDEALLLELVILAARAHQPNAGA